MHSDSGITGPADPERAEIPAEVGDELGEDLRHRLHEAAAQGEDVLTYLDLLTRTAVETLGSPFREVFCGVTLLRPRKAGTVSSSSEHALRMDEVQYSFDEGPCLTAARQEHEVYLTDVQDLPRGSEYRQAMEEFGIRSVLATPIRLPADSYSALNLYSTESDAFDTYARRLARRFAEEAAKSMRIAVHIANLSDTGTDLRAAMDSRHLIDTAVGVLMSQNRCSQEEAFSLLRAASSSRNIKLRDLAQGIVESIG